MKYPSQPQLALCATLFAVASAAVAQEYPVKPLRMIVPLSPGGLVDTFGRTVAQHLTERMGQPVVVENRAGASQAIAIEAQAKSAPDGYTIMMGTQSGMVSTTVLRKSLPYDPLRDIQPVSLLFESPLYLVVHPTVAAGSVPELIKLARAQPGKLTFASIGTGTAPHIGAAVFMKLAGVEMTHVPYKGSTAAHPDLIAGRVALMFDTVAAIAPQIKGGKVRGLAVTTARRSAALPDLPTMAEAGLKGYDTSTWGGLLAPAGTPRDVVARINAEVNKALASPDVREKLALAGIEPVGGTPAQFGGFIQNEMQRWGQVAQRAGIQPE